MEENIFQEYNYLIHHIGDITVFGEYSLAKNGGESIGCHGKNLYLLPHISHKIKFHIGYWPKREEDTIKIFEEIIGAHLLNLE